MTALLACVRNYLLSESCVRILRDKNLKRKQEESNSEYVKYIILVVPRSY